MSETLRFVAPISAVLLFSVGCGGGGTPAANSPASGGSDDQQQGAAPADPSKPVGPKAVNAGQEITTALVDDFEDGNNQSQMADMRGGYWYTYADKEGTTVDQAGDYSPSEGGAGDSKYSGKLSGTLASAQIVYAGVGVSFTDPKRPYDASSCTGVSFMGKKNGESTAQVRLKVGDWQTSPEGGLCQQCYNDFGMDFTFSDEWAEYTINFADMKQEPYWGEPKAAIDPTALYQLQWQVKAPGSAFDIQIDDVKLLGCGK